MKLKELVTYWTTYKFCINPSPLPLPVINAPEDYSRPFILKSIFFFI